VSAADRAVGRGKALDHEHADVVDDVQAVTCREGSDDAVPERRPWPCQKIAAAV
jgi:hypothetical protein